MHINAVNDMVEVCIAVVSALHAAVATCAVPAARCSHQLA